MKTLEEKRCEIFAIKDPHEACIQLSTDMECPLDIAEQVMKEYMEKYGLCAEEMMYYPNGQPVVTLEVFEERTKGQMCSKEGMANNI